MPPRKRVRTSQATSPAPSSQAKSPAPTELQLEEQLLNDPWTDEEEVGLLKGLIRWKPTGVHKHFKLLALYQFLVREGYSHPGNEHTKPAGIWQKLNSLYDLEALDAREDARQLSDLSVNNSEGGDSDREEEEQEYYSEAVNKIHNGDFSLPDDDDYAELKWMQRFASTKSRRDESPAALPELNLAEVPPVRFTPSFSVEPDELSILMPKRRRGRPKGTKNGPASVAAVPSTTTRRSTRHAESVADDDEAGDDESRNEQEDVDEDEEEEEEEDDDEEDENEDEEDSGSNEEEEESEQEPATTRAKRAGRRSSRPKPATRTSTRTRIKGR